MNHDLLFSEFNYIFVFICRYVAPEYASTGMLNERSDVYSFGILIMEIISGRNPVDYSRPAGEVCFKQSRVHNSYLITRMTSTNW